jgi:ribonuclease-3
VTAEFTAEIAEGPAASVDFKSALQEALQARGAPVPAYVVVDESGPSHRRVFKVHCLIDGRVAAEGEGSSKKSAQQDAARKALADLTAGG